MADDAKLLTIDANSSWTNRLLTSGQPPKPIPHLSNCATALRYAPAWSGVLAVNTLSHVVCTERPTPWRQSYEEWTDLADGLTSIWLQDHGLNVTTTTASEAVRIVARERDYNPLLNYLNELEWDGWARVDTWLVDYMGAEDSIYTRAVGRAWLISAVARAFQPGVKVDHALILEGPQGRGKSSALKALASPAWFTDYLSENLGSKEASILCNGVWIVEFSELEGIIHQQSKVETVKAFLTRTDDRYRPPYARHAINLPRQCIFAATTNRETYMNDETGNRRFWPIKCGWIYPSRIERDRDQLWAEAVKLYLEGSPWWLNEEMEAEAKHEQKLRHDADPWEEAIGTWLAKRKDSSTDEILRDCLNKDTGEWTRADQMRVSRCLKSLGWERFRVAGSGHRRYKSTK